MESDQRYYLRRAAEERTAALRSITPEAKAWHSKLAAEFAERAISALPTPMPMAFAISRSALSA